MNEMLRTKLLAGSGGAAAIAMVLIADFEGYSATPYRDVAGILTVCYGHTGPDIVPGKVYSKAECESLLRKDSATAIKVVDESVRYRLTNGQRAALYSFTYNVGTGAFKRSTLLKKLNAGDLTGACNELRRWTYAGGKQWKGLLTRREVERELCLGGSPWS